MKILIITAFFPPQNSIAAQRPYSWAKYWSRQGHDITVLTTDFRSGGSDSPQSFEGFTVLRVPVPMPGWMERFRSRSGELSDGAVTSRLAADKPGWVGRLKQQLVRVLTRWREHYGVAHSCRMPDRLDWWYGAAMRALEGSQWDTVVSTAGPYPVHRPAYALRTSGRAQWWIADWRDLWVDNHIFPGLPGVRVIERWLERRWNGQADLLTTVSQPLATTLRAKYGDKVHVVFNGYDPEDWQSAGEAPVRVDPEVFRLVYTGSLYPGRQNPAPLFAALLRLEERGVIRPDRFQVDFYGNARGIGELALQAGVAHYVRYWGDVPRDQSLQHQRTASALLLLEIESDNAKGVLTGKLFEYLFAARPILAIGRSPDQAVADVLRDSGCGVALGTDVQRIEDHLARLLSADGAQQAEGVPNLDVVKGYSRPAQALQMLALLQRKRPGSPDPAREATP